MGKYRDVNRKSLTMLEIGVDNGGGLEIWKKYFPANTVIHGIDINEDCAKLKFPENIHFHLGDATNADFIREHFEDEQFDIILDDGSHHPKDVIAAFLNLFPLLKNGGIYLVEDCELSYQKNCLNGGFLKKGSTIEFFKSLVDSLNYDYIDAADLTREQKKTLKEYNKMIRKILFYPNICAIEKYAREKEEPFQTLMTGLIDYANPLSRKRPEDLRALIEINKEMFS
ncbi:MAG: class I SAM-dependent methyltransferase [Puniceicoccales bacterium]|nr:class I SAM-dependent methyltransferase [Puniceicoccales bacterium]